MKKILQSANYACCKNIDIFCPCSENELELIVNFLYNGIMFENMESTVKEVSHTLTKIFGYPHELFVIEKIDKLKIANVEIENFKEKYESKQDLKASICNNILEYAKEEKCLAEPDPLIIPFNPVNGITNHMWA